MGPRTKEDATEHADGEGSIAQQEKRWKIPTQHALLIENGTERGPLTKTGRRKIKMKRYKEEVKR